MSKNSYVLKRSPLLMKMTQCLVAAWQAPPRGAEGQGGGRLCPRCSSWLSQAHCVLASPSCWAPTWPWGLVGQTSFNTFLEQNNPSLQKSTY